MSDVVIVRRSTPVRARVSLRTARRELLGAEFRVERLTTRRAGEPSAFAARRSARAAPPGQPRRIENDSQFKTPWRWRVLLAGVAILGAVAAHWLGFWTVFLLLAVPVVATGFLRGWRMQRQIERLRHDSLATNPPGLIEPPKEAR